MRAFGRFRSAAVPALAAVTLAVAGCSAGSSPSPASTGKPGTPAAETSPTPSFRALPNFIFPMYPPSANTNANTVAFQYLNSPAHVLVRPRHEPDVQCHQLAGRGAGVFGRRRLSHGQPEAVEVVERRGAGRSDVMFWMNMLKADQSAWGSPARATSRTTSTSLPPASTPWSSTYHTLYDPTWFTYNQLPAQITPMPIAWTGRRWAPPRDQAGARLPATPR